jgi:HK97 family phage major capsid protein
MVTKSVDLTGLIPNTISNVIAQEAVSQSAVMTLGTRVPIPAGKSSVPIPALFPEAEFVNEPGGRKPFTRFAFQTRDITAEEIATTVAIPDSYLEDSAINLWAFARPRLAEAIGRVVDRAVIANQGAPASYPTGGITAFATRAPDGIDAIDTVNNAMGEVEDRGMLITGHAVDIRAKSVFRGVRDNTGALLLDRQQVEQRQMDSLYGAPIAWTALQGADFDFVTGNWGCLVVGIRSDIRYKFSDNGVLADSDGRVTVSAFQDNQTLLKVWARIGVAIVKPITQFSEHEDPEDPDSPLVGENPFSYATLKPRGAAATGRRVAVKASAKS